MSDVKVGRLLDGTEERDAIHVAIAPCVAGERLFAGQHVAVDANLTATISGKPYVGIVDPYLVVTVLPGQRCYVFLYPQTVTSLRHQWTHPAFDPPVPSEPEATRRALALQGLPKFPPEPAAPPSPAFDPTETSRLWLEAFARDVLDVTYSFLMGMADRWIEDGDYEVQHGDESWRNAFYADAARVRTFWLHYAAVSGKHVPDPDAVPFSCSC